MSSPKDTGGIRDEPGPRRLWLPRTGLPRRDAAARTAPAPWFALIRTAAVVVFLYLSWRGSVGFGSVLMLGFIWAIAAIGLALVLGSAGQMMLCQAAFMIVGAYVYGWLTVSEGVPTVVAAIVAAAAGGLGGVALSPVLRLKGYVFALGTIAVSLLVNQITTTASWIPGGNVGLSGIPPLNLGFATLTSDGSYALLAVAVLIVAVPLLHRLFGLGYRSRHIQFIKHDEELLGALAGDPVRLKRILVITASVLGGLAGAIYVAGFGFFDASSLTLADSYVLALIVVLGGGGRMLGAVLGAVVYEASFTVLGQNNSQWRYALVGGMVILVVHFYPRGLLPARDEFERWFPRIRRREPPVSARPPAYDVSPPLGVDLRGVKKRFGALTAIDDITVVIEPGSLVALVGPNGAGKSTLLDVIAGAPTTRGEILLGDRSVTDMPVKERAALGMSRTFQRVRLIPSLSVLDNVIAGADHWSARSSRRVPERARVALAMEAIREVGLAGRERASVETLSFGDRRLVEFARVIASRPRLVLLDEPSSGLNDAEVDSFAALVRRLHERGCTVLLVEHNLPLVRELAHEVIAIDRGRLLVHGATRTVFEHTGFQQAYIGSAKAVPT